MPLSSPQRQAAIWLAIGLVAGLLVWQLAPVITPFVVAGVLGYVLHPLVERIVQRGVPRLAAVALVELAAILVIMALLLLIVPILSEQAPLLREQIPLFAARLNAGLAPVLAWFGIDVAFDIGSIKAFVRRYLDANLAEWGRTAVSSARIGGSVLLAVVGNALLVPVVVFYLLMDWNNLVRRIAVMVPPRLRDRVQRFALECDAVLGQYLRGQLTLMLTMAVFYSAGLSLFGFHLAIPVGVFTGLAVFVPYVGFGLGLVMALICGVLQFSGWHGVVGVAVVYGVGQVLESMVLVPRLVGERIGLNPLTVIFALLAFGHLFGFIGVLIALPVSAVLVVAARRVRSVYLASDLFRG